MSKSVQGRHGCLYKSQDDFPNSKSPAISLECNFVNLRSIVVDWSHVWWYHYRLLDDVQSQKRNDHWHVDRLHNSVAVSLAASVHRLHTHICAGEALRSRIFPTLRWVTTAGSTSRRSHTSILSTTLSTHWTGMLASMAHNLPLPCSHFFMWISSTARLHCMQWHDSVVPWILRRARRPASSGPGRWR